VRARVGELAAATAALRGATADDRVRAVLGALLAGDGALPRVGLIAKTDAEDGRPPAVLRAEIERAGGRVATFVPSGGAGRLRGRLGRVPARGHVAFVIEAQR
jgi:hypothetical protein